MARSRRFVLRAFVLASARSGRASALASAVAIAAVLAASCKDKPADTATTDAAPSMTLDAAVALPAASTPMPASSADGRGGERGGPREAHGGPSGMLFQAARALDLSDDQKTRIEAAEKIAHGGPTDASRDAMKNAAKDLHTDLVAGIRAGKVDTSKLEPRYAAVEKIIGDSQTKQAEALNALHDALDTTQRRAVTANVRAKQAMREEKMAHREGMDGGAAMGGADGGKAHWTSKRSFDRLTHGLELDVDQQKKVDALVANEDAAKAAHPDGAELKKSVEAMLTAFDKDTFDAKKLDALDVKKARAPMEQEARLVAQLVPILKPEQREKLAAKMEKGPSPHAGRGDGFRPRPILEESDDD
jgi:Spy/CpxP family protein refolding chaperone